MVKNSFLHFALVRVVICCNMQSQIPMKACVYNLIYNNEWMFYRVMLHPHFIFLFFLLSSDIAVLCWWQDWAACLRKDPRRCWVDSELCGLLKLIQGSSKAPSEAVLLWLQVWALQQWHQGRPHDSGERDRWQQGEVINNILYL